MCWLKTLLLAWALGAASLVVAEDAVVPAEAEAIDASAVPPGKDPDKEELEKQQAKDAEKLKEASGTTVRRFHEVLDELLAEFGYDIKMGQITGLKNIAIRKTTVSDTLPRSYTDYIELLVSERIRENSRVRIISCIPCKTKTSRIVEGRLMITSPQTNMAEMTRAADQLGIDYFMDVVLVYHTTHMVLAFQVFNTSSKEMVWARTYNSETIKTRFQKLAIDYAQVGQAKPGEEYKPEYRLFLGFGAASIPNVGGGATDNSFLDLHIRGTEKFDNRKSEFGILFNIFTKTSSILKDYPTEKATAPETPDPADTPVTTIDQPKPFSFAILLMAIYSYNFLGTIESYNEIRSGMNIGLGAFVAPGYLAGTIRVGYDMYFGRRFATGIGGLFIMPSQVLVNKAFVAAPGGPGGELVFAFNF